MKVTPKHILKYILLILFIGAFAYLYNYYFTPYEQERTFSKIDPKLPTTIVAVASQNNKITQNILTNLETINKTKQNIVYSTNTKLSRYQINKLKPYVNHIIADTKNKNKWFLYKKALVWLLVSNKNKHTPKLIYIKENINKIYTPKPSINTFSSSPKRYAVFAGYNKNSIIEPYIITYLKGLNEVTSGIVYIADSPLKEGELDKLKDINILYTQHQKHHKYDFGSYAIGYNWLKDNGYLKNADELIFANDSAYAPLTSFKPIFEKMNTQTELDFWGITQGRQFISHLCSYFLVYRANVFNSFEFHEILNTIPSSLDHTSAIFEYELKITPYLESLGYKWDTYIPYEDLEYLPYEAKDWYPLSLISKHKNQFFKRRVYNDEDFSQENIFELLDYLKQNHPQTYQDVIFANHKLLQSPKDKDN